MSPTEDSRRTCTTRTGNDDFSADVMSQGLRWIKIRKLKNTLAPAGHCVEFGIADPFEPLRGVFRLKDILDMDMTHWPAFSSNPQVVAMVSGLVGVSTFWN